VSKTLLLLILILKFAYFLETESSFLPNTLLLHKGAAPTDLTAPPLLS